MKQLFGLMVLLLAATSCDDYLEETPDNRVELNTLDKAAQLLTNAYSEGGYNFVEWMGDMVTYTRGTTKEDQHNQAYQWQEVDELFQDSPTFYWNETYEAIAHANEVLAVIDDLPGDDDQRNAVKGEALLTRAYGHFMLVNLFAKHYDEASAANDRGIPYVMEPETEFIKQYERLSVKAVYDRVEDDLLQGLELLDGSFYANSGKYHFTRNAALAFASRFYLFKGDLNSCIDYSSQMLGANPDVFVKDLAALLEERVNTEDYVRLYTSPNDPSNLLLMRKITNFHLTVGYWPDDEVYSGRIFGNNPFDATDLREDPAYVRGDNGLSATRFEFLFERSSLTSGVGFNYTIVLPFRGEEVLLNRAESYAKQNRVNEALADLQTLWNKRYDSPVSLTLEEVQRYVGEDDPRIALLIYIVEIERPKEFVHEGLRWFDIKRYDIPVTHELENGSTITLEAEDNRRVLQIPEAAQDVGGLAPNPR
ncbi:tetratricopeptide (TPR) repeat protein [Catalinimonas alkaloidigena]|uniref:RagB/SusD family nutrient uptake outer membrane protein n=1 Tax=Catalinimonas alkaloidigena TaxID=1075417 RepID=UPI002406289F|nr:RagB/SusD family nutrient uptake outer membrane protein [Catalinimonas alkaloidigena]MDF9795931.1 tetratricopeptide (TPR) repeat protein [Catalinimonas alkaloidigena]